MICARCHKREATRTYRNAYMAERQPYCTLCEAAVLEPVRERYGFTRIYRASPIAKADLGWQLQCRTCRAEWVGELLEECKWCIRREQLQREEERNRLLNPPWSVNGVYTPTADALREWLQEIALGITGGLITREEAERTIERYTE